MKITLLGPTYPFKGGVSHYNTLLYQNLSKKHNVDAISFKRQYPQFLIKLLFKAKEQKETKSEFKLHMPNRQIIDSINPLTWFKVLKEIKKNNSELVVFHWLTPFWSIFDYFITKFTKAKTLCVCHNVIPHEGFFIDKFLTKFALKNTNHFIVHSKSSEEDLKRILPNAKTKINPHPTYDMFKVDKIKSKEQARKLLNIKDKTMIFFGYVRKYKGLDVLIKAMPEVLKQLKIKLLVVGQFWGKQEYLDLIKKHKLEKHIIIVDDYVPNEEVEKYFKAADVAVLPYNSATNSGIIQTSFGFDTPVIATNVGGLPEVVLNNKTGYIVPPKNPKKLAEAIIKYYKQNKEKEFIKNIQKDKKRFSWGNLIETIESFYK